MNNNSMLLIVLAVLGSSSISGVYGQWDPENSESCTDCAKNADGMLKCVEKHCGPDYAYCISTPSFDGASSLPDCCDMNDSDCEEYATKVDDCLADCLPKCVNKKISDYLDCTSYTSTITSASGCDLNDCYAGIAIDRDWVETDLKNTDKFFKKLTDNISDMSSSDAEEICGGAEGKARDVCKIGETCCEPCVKELSDVMDCVVNDMILPYKLSSYSSTDDDCEVQCNKLTRSLETDNTNTTVEDNTTESLTGNAEQDAAISAKSKEALKPCFNQMNLQIVLGNVTKAGDELINCMVNESVKVLVTDDSTAKDTTTTTATTNAASPAATIVVKASIISVFVVAAATSVIALV